MTATAAPGEALASQVIVTGPSAEVWLVIRHPSKAGPHDRSFPGETNPRTPSMPTPSALAVIWSLQGDVGHWTSIVHIAPPSVPVPVATTKAACRVHDAASVADAGDGIKAASAIMIKRTSRLGIPSRLAVAREPG